MAPIRWWIPRSARRVQHTQNFYSLTDTRCPAVFKTTSRTLAWPLILGMLNDILSVTRGHVAGRVFEERKNLISRVNL